MRILVLLFFLSVTLAAPLISEAQPGGHRMMRRGMPYGQYCPGGQSRPYGAPKPVKTADEAKRLIESYYFNCGRRLHCGGIEEKDSYFEADVVTPDGSVIDKVIVDKRTGRIRSIY